MSYLKNMMSYVLPVYEETFHSEISGKIELNRVNGILQLDAPHANYSYGSLQRILKMGLLRFDKKLISDSENILILGLGGGCVIETLRKDFRNQGRITAVEIDPLMISISETVFNLSEYKPLSLIQSDAYDYIATIKEQFDLVIIDLFIDDVVPDKFHSSEFISKLSSCFTNRGIGIFNTMNVSQKQLLINNQLTTTLSHYFAVDIIKGIEKTNDLYLLKQK